MLERYLDMISLGDLSVKIGQKLDLLDTSL
jgi:hypothetical protein